MDCMVLHVTENMQNYDLKIVNSSMQTHKSQLIKQTMIYGRVNC